MNWEQLISSKRLRQSNADGNRKNMSNQLDTRNPFESDFGRVVFSAASRRLHDKTQVFPLTSDDNIHSRLTHSMEVMNIGLSFSIYLCSNEDFQKHTGLSEIEILRKINPILKTACLVHDIGNPPFGHFGEEVFQDYFLDLITDIKAILAGTQVTNQIANCIYESLDEDQKKETLSILNKNEIIDDYIHFDGNAQGLRVLNKLQYLGDLYGLNLTYGTLAATLKYPNFGSPEKDGSIAKHKHGVFYTEKESVKLIAKDCGMLLPDETIIRHPLAFLMEAADSICYLVMDIEDAISKNWLSSNTVENMIKECPNIEEKVINKLINNRDINKGLDGPSMKDWVMMRTTLLSHLMEVATNNFINHLSDIEKGNYNEELIEDGDGVYSVLKSLTNQYVLKRREIISLEITGRAVINGLFDSYLTMLFHKNKKVRSRAKSLISKSILKTVLHEHLKEKNPEISGNDVDCAYKDWDVKDFSVEERFRLIRDYVACMTDKFALTQYQKISGQKI